MSLDQTRFVRNVRTGSWLGGLAAMMLWVASAAAQPAATPFARDTREKAPAADNAANVLIDELRPGDVTDTAPVARTDKVKRNFDINQEVQQARAEVQKLRDELRAAQLRVAELERALSQQKKLGVRFAPPPPARLSVNPPPGMTGTGSVSVFVTPEVDTSSPAAPTRYELSVTKAAPNAVIVARDGQVVTAIPVNRERRLEALERQVQAMLEEVRSLRNEANAGAAKSDAADRQGINQQPWGQPMPAK